ncbi:MAG TPA: hypothetical protein VIV60_31860 [Polyangiaceae bacterium]
MKKVTLTLRRQRASLMLGSALLLGQSAVLAQLAPTAPKPAQPAPEALPAVPAASAVSTEAAEAPTVSPTSTEMHDPQPTAAATAPAASAATVVAPQPAAATEEAAAVADDEAQQVAEEMGDEPSKLNVYGFADFTYAHGLSDRSNFVQYVPYPTFYVGNLNLYLDANLGHNWRSLAEVRFTYLPDGAESSVVSLGGTGRTSAVYQDYIDFRRNTKVGGVIIERAWVEYAAHPLFTARVGNWLTPYGIWNVDHGSTVVIPVSRPYIIGDELFPQRQTGIELYGSTGFDSTQFGYHLTVSNGRGPVDEYRDLDKNKAIGWRLWAQQDTSFGTFTLGTSGYKGRYTDRSHMQNVAVQGTQIALSNTYKAETEYRELSLALDLRWTWKGALVQSEAIMHDTAYEESARQVSANGAPGWTPDTRNFGFYGMAGYRLPWLGVMPFYGYDFYRAYSIDAAALWGGLNIRPTDRVVVKLQETHVWFPNGFGGIVAPHPVDYFFAQIAWSF